MSSPFWEAVHALGILFRSLERERVTDVLETTDLLAEVVPGQGDVPDLIREGDPQQPLAGE